MKPKMSFTLKAGERIFINGAVLTVNSKVTLSLLNQAHFLLESHVLQVADANTPMRQLYFVIQSFLINPGEAQKATAVFKDLHASLLLTCADDEAKTGLLEAGRLVEIGRMFDALKVVRNMFEPATGQKTTPGAAAAAYQAA